MQHSQLNKSLYGHYSLVSIYPNMWAPRYITKKDNYENWILKANMEVLPYFKYIDTCVTRNAQVIRQIL